MANIYASATPSLSQPPPTSSSSSSTPFLFPDNNAYYSNSYYPTASPYYFSYGAPATTSSPYSFMTPLNYPIGNDPNVDSKSFFPIQSSNDNGNYLSSLLPLPSDTSDQY